MSVKLKDVATLESDSSKVYPKGTILVRMSVIPDMFSRLDKEGKLSNYFLALIPKDGLNNYLAFVLEPAYEKLKNTLYKSVLNCKTEDFLNMELQWHDDLKTRLEIDALVAHLDEEILLTEQSIDRLKQLKGYAMSKMFIED